MSWLVWRQHRLEGAWALAIAGLMGLAMTLVTYQLHRAGQACPGNIGGYCFIEDAGGALAKQLVRYNLYQYGLVVLPALAGAFIGCPLVAREIENGTHHLAWTQGVTRVRWLLVKLSFVFVPLLAGAAAVGVLEVVLINQLGTQPNHWAYFDQQAPMTVGATFFALSLGVASGAFVGKSIPAMAATLVAFVVVRIGLAEFARAAYVAPLLYRSSGLSDPGASDPTAWWLDHPQFHDAAGHVSDLPSGLVGQAAYVTQYFQPGDRFWAFQTIESAILSVLALLLVGFAIYWVTRRVA